MAVYEGARPRTIGLPRSRRIAEGPRLDRRRVRAAFRAGRRTNRLGIVLGAIVVTFMLAFFSLAQQVRVSATGLDIGRLELQRQDLEDTAADIRSDLNRLRTHQQILEGIFGRGDAANPNHRDSYRLDHLINHPYSYWFYGRPRESAGKIAQSWPMGVHIDRHTQ